MLILYIFHIFLKHKFLKKTYLTSILAPLVQNDAYILENRLTSILGIGTE